MLSGILYILGLEKDRMRGFQSLYGVFVQRTAKKRVSVEVTGECRGGGSTKYEVGEYLGGTKYSSRSSCVRSRKKTGGSRRKHLSEMICKERPGGDVS